MSSSLPITCKPTNWFKSRAALMLAMFVGFAGWFYLDGSTGYRKKNKVYYLNSNFQTAENTFKEKINEEPPIDEAGWKAFAAEQKFTFPSDAADVLPIDMELDQPWPAELADFAKLKEKENVSELWKTYAARINIDEEAPEKAYSKGDITEQFWVAGVCVLLALVTVFFFLRTMGRKMLATEESVTLPGTQPIPYAAIQKLDKRKWDNKGLAYVEYEEEGETKKGRVDGMVYGGFKSEEDQPAEQLMKQIEARMDGEILEYVAEDDDDEDEESSESQD